MAYRHFLLLGGSDDGSAKLDHVDFGPARADATITGRVLEYLRSADRLIETTLAPAALLAERFGLLPTGTDFVELDTLLGYFYKIPRLPKLANAQVLRQSLVEGVRKGLFGLASGSAWDAEDAVLRFSEAVEPSEIQFQPGTWLVRASSIKELIALRTPSEPPVAEPGGRLPQSPSELAGTPEAAEGDKHEGLDGSPRPATGPLPGVTIRIKDIPASRMRDVVKVAILPLSAASSDVTVDLTIRADGGLSGIPRETLNLVTLEGLRQLALTDVEVSPHEPK
jgi:hypothetical protein